MSTTTATTTSHRRLIRRSHYPLLSPRLRIQLRRKPNLVSAKAIEVNLPASNSPQSSEIQIPIESSILLDVSGMMYGACVIRVKKLIAADDRVESAVVNMMTETAAVRLKSEVSNGGLVAEELAKRLNECGFEAKKRVAGSGVGERVKKWKEMAAKKKEMAEKSRNRVIIAWTLVALCCGSHILHSFGIHVGHGRRRPKHEAPIQRLADSIAGPFVYSVMTLSLATFAFRYSIGTTIFPDVLLNDIAGPEVSCPCALGLATPTAILVVTSIGTRQGLLLRGGDVLERLAGVDYMAFDKTGTLTEGKPSVSAVASLAYDSSEILQLAVAVEKTTSHPLANAILSKAESCGLQIPSTTRQLTEPAYGTLAEVDGRLVAVGALEWICKRFERKNQLDIAHMERSLVLESARPTSSLDKSVTVVYVGREGEGVIGAIAISDTLRHDAEATVERLEGLGIKPILLSGDREEAVAKVGRIIGINDELVQASLNPQRKSQFISDLQASGHHIAMVGDGINDAPSLALADVGIALKTGMQENAASDAASIVLLGNKLAQVVDAVDLARATMSEVHQNFLWAVAYNVVTIPVAAGVLLPHFDFAMTRSLSGGLMALSSIFVVSNSLLLQLHGFKRERKELAPNTEMSLKL